MKLVSRNTLLDNPRLVTSSVTVESSDRFLLVDATTGNKIITLPSPALLGNGLSIVTIQKYDSSTNLVTINGSIDNMSSYIMASKNEYITLYPNGNSWRIIDRFWSGAAVKYPIGVSSASYNLTADVQVSAAGWDAAKTLLGSARQHGSIADGIAMRVPFLPPGTYELTFNGDFRAGSGGFDARVFFRNSAPIGDTGFMNVQNFPSALRSGMVSVFTITAPVVNFEVHCRWQTTNTSTSIQVFNGNGFNSESHLCLKVINFL